MADGAGRAARCRSVRPSVVAANKRVVSDDSQQVLAE